MADNLYKKFAEMKKQYDEDLQKYTQNAPDKQQATNLFRIGTKYFKPELLPDRNFPCEKCVEKNLECKKDNRTEFQCSRWNTLVQNNRTSECITDRLKFYGLKIED